ncbi:uncharacterized protein LOC122349790 [Puntigrus tetrazona]|uniref:uncharacterized protein LOC122349790 n=1 Tax=Puntigrus tetrazona TaxID=1606681 RepID=UPI001C892FFB|nr:uncharacterized protein LOC122349790 [Puntigrus tetrazona]
METALMPALKMFALRANILMSCISCVSMIPEVFQPNVSITAAVDGSVTLDCHTTADLVVAWFWLKQTPGQKLIPIVSTYYQEIKLKEEFVNESRLQLKVEGNKSALTLTKITSADAAFYHCGVVLYEKLYFGGGTFLKVNDAMPVQVIQHPVLDSHRVGDSVTLHCSIFGESCSGGQSVFWLRYKPRESHSGVIYTDGGSEDQCEKISVTGSSVQSCVHKVPKSVFGDETYFCGVVACGKLIIGNGTKLKADVVPQKTIIYIITPLCAVLLISVIVNIIMVLLWRRATHKGVDHSKPTAQTTDIDSENYASLKFSPNQPTQNMKNREERTSVIYASVRQTRSIKQGFPRS